MSSPSAQMPTDLQTDNAKLRNVSPYSYTPIAFRNHTNKLQSTKLQTKEMWLIVMGLTGAGKSTFIKTVTGDDTIVVGEDDDYLGVTQEVRDSILEYTHDQVHWIIHLVDSPGFDDGVQTDPRVLKSISEYLNFVYKLKRPIAGILYLHDIAKGKIGETGIRNIRMLENLIGYGKFANCTLVTTKWGCTTNPGGEERRELKLIRNEMLFEEMSKNNMRMRRFMGTRESALEIIGQHLGHDFAPNISIQMVDSDGPRLQLLYTDAGKILASPLREAIAANKDKEEALAKLDLMRETFDEITFADFVKKRDSLRHKQAWARAGRWAIRSVIIGSGVTATVFTLGPGASVFSLEPVFENFVAKPQKRKALAQRRQLERDFAKQSSKSEKLASIGPAFLGDKKVKTLKDVAQYNLDGPSDTSLQRTSLDTSVGGSIEVGTPDRSKGKKGVWKRSFEKSRIDSGAGSDDASMCNSVS